MFVLDIFKMFYRYSGGKLRQTIYEGLGRILFWKALEMSKTRIINPYTNALDMMMQRGEM